MKITFYGAAGVVTGSAYLLQSSSATVMVDFGMFQGASDLEARNRVLPDIDVDKIDAVVLTHAHLDHSGRLPLLSRHGSYSGPIFATEAAIEMAELILEDSARINASDTKRENRKRERAGQDLLEPLYEPQDAQRILSRMRSVPYDQPVKVAPGVVAHFVEAGHMLGSASVQLTFEDEGQRKVIFFSGDIGPHNLPILRTADPLERADMVIMESTYGDRDHRSLEDTLVEGEAIIKSAVEKKGKILVPSFAIGWAQQLMYHMAALFASGRVEPFPVYVDSPMAAKATAIYGDNIELFDEEALAMMESGQLQNGLKTIKATSSVAESKAINNAPDPCMVIATSGMCNGGRILHHLRHNLWRPQTTVILVGYQAVGTLGRQLVEGAETVRIYGDSIEVNAEIHTLNGFSAHAGQTDLMNWFDHVAGGYPRVVLTHGESRQRKALASLIDERYGIRPHLPFLGDVIEI